MIAKRQRGVKRIGIRARKFEGKVTGKEKGKVQITTTPSAPDQNMIKLLKNK